jgi:hypothetical protein
MDIKLEPKQKTQTIAFRITGEDFAFLNEVAKKQGMPLARVCSYIFYAHFIKVKPNLEKLLKRKTKHGI